MDLFAGLAVSEREPAVAWCTSLLGSDPAFFPNDDEAVWEVREHGYVYVVVQPEHAGHGRVTLFVEDLPERVAAISARGLEPATDETYDNGVRKVTYRDPDGNEVGLGGST